MALHLSHEGDRDFKDKRSHTRRRMNKFLRLTDRKTGHVLGRVMDMTVDGMMIVSAQGLKNNEKLSLSLILPGGFDDAGKVNFDACVVWTKKSGYSSNYASGMRISSISENDANLIDKLVKGCGM